MTDLERCHAAVKFAAEWAGKGYEKGQSQPFWLSLSRNNFGVDEPESIKLCDLEKEYYDIQLAYAKKNKE